jgi:L-fuconolactonase
VRIDAHHHVWRLARGDYGWLTPAAGVLYQDFEPEMLRPRLLAGGVEAAILVQAAPTEAETDFLLATARAHPWIVGVVGWTDLSAPDAAEHVASLSRRPGLVGLRPMLQDLEDRAWILGSAVAPGLEAMARHGLVFDALVRDDQLGVVAQLAQRHARLTIVLDHAGKPCFEPAALRAWEAGIRAVAAAPNASVKLSGLLTEAPIGADVAVLRPILSVLLDAFGADRIVWGSDWPMLTLASDYAAWLDMTSSLLEPLGETQRAAIMGGNAARLYGLKRLHGLKDHDHD